MQDFIHQSYFTKNSTNVLGSNFKYFFSQLNSKEEQNFKFLIEELIVNWFIDQKKTAKALQKMGKVYWKEFAKKKWQKTL